MSGGADAMNIVVQVRLRFNPDGRLAAPPVIVNPQSTAVFLAMSDSAMRAILACDPYPLPPDKYDYWKDTIVKLSPKDNY